MMTPLRRAMHDPMLEADVAGAQPTSTACQAMAPTHG